MKQSFWYSRTREESYVPLLRDILHQEVFISCISTRVQKRSFFPCWVKYYSRSTPRTSDDFPSPKKRFFCCPSLRNLKERGELVILELSACFLFRETWINVPCIFCPFFFPPYPEGALKGTKRDKLSARGDAHTDRSSQYYHDLVKFLLRKHFKTPRNSSNSSLDQDIASGKKSPKDIGLRHRIVLAESSFCEKYVVLKGRLFLLP